MITNDSQSTDIILAIEEMLSVCTPIQQDRIRKFYLEGMSISEIANGKNINAVYKSIHSGLKKSKKVSCEGRKTGALIPYLVKGVFTP